MRRQIRAAAAVTALLVLGSTACGSPPRPAAHRTTGSTVITAGIGVASPVTGWHIQSSAVATSGGEVISRPGFDPAGWYRVSRRSTVMAGLIENRKLPADLCHSTNLQKVDRAQFQVPWWYRETITVDGDAPHTTLRLAGVTSKADVWLNGVRIATAAAVIGSHNATEVDISRQLRPGANGLAMRVQPADANRDFAIGWIDWNPYPPDNNMGIWQDVTLHRTGPVSLSRPRVRAKLATPARTSADITVTVDARNHGAAPLTAPVAGTVGAVTFRRDVALKAGERKAVTFTPTDTPQLRFADAKLWWPAGLGAQHLYPLRLTAESAGTLSDSVATTFGVREVTSALDRNGYRQFTVNGKPLLLRGGGWASDAPALFVEATLRRPDGTRVPPVSWSDNDVTLWPGESTTLTATYRASDLGAGQPAVDVSGFNVDRIRA